MMQHWCFEAYEGGREGLRKTLEWKDCYAVEREKMGDGSEGELSARADFAALRGLHAKQASDLGEKEWCASNGDKIFLIDDHEVRHRYGQAIGLIAASHHWPIEDLCTKLPSQINAPGTFPRDWRVDPVKIACLLRCADAAHIDSRRAPDFMYALIRREGVSAGHWKAQNWLARADIDQADTSGTSLLITSNRDFGKDDVGAWWVAYDAICLIDAELKSTNLLLASRPQKETSPVFKVQRVSGASSPEATSESVRVEGWKPCSAKVHVGNVERLVRNLGGENLYGAADQFDVALRELIQNARDAVVARRSIDPDYVGSIKIQVRFREGGQAYLDVEDDGVGMSERVLTGPLLDFGTSFWISNLVQSEFPGLRSSRFRSVGRFGVGFYSIFMISKSVSISTRRWDAGLEDVRTLDFSNGLTLRPTLSKGRPAQFGSYTSTKVSCCLTETLAYPPTMTIRSGRLGQADMLVAFEDYIAAIVAGIDVCVMFRSSPDEKHTSVHEPIVDTMSSNERLRWLEKISFAKQFGDQHLEGMLPFYADRLRPIYEDGRICGLATLPVHFSTQGDFSSIRTIGGLAVTVHGGNEADFIGFLDYKPNSARRDMSAFTSARPDTLKKWADDQIHLLKASNADPLHWCIVTESLSQLGIDPLPIAHALIAIDGTFVSMNLAQIIEIVRIRGLAIFRSSALNHIETYHREANYENYPTFKPIRNSKFCYLDAERNPGECRRGFMGCLERFAHSQGVELVVEERRNAAQAHFGPMHVLIVTLAK